MKRLDSHMALRERERERERESYNLVNQKIINKYIKGNIILSGSFHNTG